MLLGIGIVLVLGILGGLVYVGLREDDDYDPLQDRLAEFAEREMPQSLDEIEMSMTFQDRVLLPFLRNIANLTGRFTPEAQIEATRHKLELAGMAGQLEPSTFYAMRVGGGALMLIGSFIVFFVAGTANIPQWQRAMLVVVFTLIGFFFPELWVRSKISRRQNEILKSLPDALDLLVICVEAGLGFDAAMGKVYEKWDNELSIAFGRVLREIQLGKARKDALRNMSDRMDVSDVTSFIAAILQAESMGVSMAKILRVQSDQMRVKRRQRAQEKAQQAPVKMMIPMVFLIFPALWIVLMGPAAIQLFNSTAIGMF